jgi:hypothetical protein
MIRRAAYLRSLNRGSQPGNELEDWLAAVVASAGMTPMSEGQGGRGQLALPAPQQAELSVAIDRLSGLLQDSSTRPATQAMAHLAEGIQGLVQHMRTEQQLIREWVESQAAQQDDIKRLLEKLLREKATTH